MAEQFGQAIAFDSATGLPLADEEALQAVTEGRAAFKQDALVHMRDPATGRAMGIPANEVSQAASEGFAFIPAAEVAANLRAKADRERYSGAGQQAIALGEGALSALSLGGTDPLLTGLGFDTAKRAEHAAAARLGGEVLGTVGSLFIPGGAAAKLGTAGRATRVATAAPRAIARTAEALGARAGAAAARGGATMSGRLLGKVAQHAVTNAAEGAVYGAGQVISEAALKDLDLTAEMLLSGAAEGAALGGLLGAGMGVGAGALGEAGRALGKSGGLREALRDSARKNAAIAAIGGDKRTVKNLLRYGGEERVARVGDRALAEPALMRDPERALTVIRKQADDAVERLKSTAKQVSEAGGQIDNKVLSKQLDDQVYAAMEGKTGSARKVADQLLEDLAPLRERLDKGALSFDEAWDYRKAVDELIDFEKKDPTAKTAALKQTRAFLSDAMDEAAARSSPEAQAAWKKANADYSDFAALRQSAEKRVEAELTKGLVKQGDMLSAGVGVAGALATGSPLAGIATGAGLGFVNRMVRDRGHEFLARAADRLSRTDSVMDDAARALAGERLRVPRRAVVPVTMALVDRYEQAREEAASATPQAIQARMESATRGLENQPGLLTAIHMGVAADAAYLQGKLPQSDVRGPATSLTPTKPTQPSRTAMSEFVSASEALKDPAGVMADVAAGHVDLAAIQALKDRRPRIYQDMRNRVMLYTAQSGEELPYKQRVILSQAFDFTADPSMKPATMASIQGSFAPQQEHPGQAPGSQRSGPQRKLTTNTADETLPGESGDTQ